MRLIDLDQTVIFTITDETQGGMQYEVQMTVAEVFDKFFGGVQPEVVEAVPVEWLKEQRKQCSRKWDVNFYESIQTVLTEWQKEQEAR